MESESIVFESLPIPEPVLQGIRDAGFKECTPIQAKTLPISLTGKDVAGQAQTGTGKTAAFLISTFTRLVTHEPMPQKGKQWVAPRALIIAPTRELALQIERDALLLGKHCEQKILCVYGGVDYEKQKDSIKKGVDILIATPGRLIDYYKQKFFSLKGVEVLVIDEADRLFDMGFIQDVRYILRNISPYQKRQSMLFSATLNFRVMELCYEHMNEPIPVKIEPDRVVVEKIKQVLYHVGKHEKFNLLLGLLKTETPGKTLIFTNMKSTAEKLEAQLKYHDYNVQQISGDLHQKKRIKVLEQFTEGEIDILIATDVASRGLHVDDITHVINYDVPQDPEDYIHRIGRTARAGRDGDAITFACEDYAEHLMAIEDTLKKKIPVEWPEDELFLEPKEGMPAFKRRRPSGPPGRRGDGGGNRRGTPSNGRRPSGGGRSRSGGPKSSSKPGGSSSSKSGAPKSGNRRRRPSGPRKNTSSSGNK
jgi:ATP-dependent RNA helicase RhlB